MPRFLVRPSRTQWLWGFSAAAVVLVVAGLILLPEFVARDSQLLIAEAAGSAIKPAERLGLHKDMLLFDADVKIKIWLGVLQALTGFALLAGLFLTWKNLLATQAKLDVDRAGQLTNRFSAATRSSVASSRTGRRTSRLGSAASTPSSG